MSNELTTYNNIQTVYKSLEKHKISYNYKLAFDAY